MSAQSSSRRHAIRLRPWMHGCELTTDLMSEQPVSEQQHAIASDCAKEPIHIPGAIQPHGYLFVLAPTGEILQASANAEALFGVDVERLRNTRITEWLASYESS